MGKAVMIGTMIDLGEYGPQASQMRADVRVEPVDAERVQLRLKHQE